MIAGILGAVTAIGGVVSNIFGYKSTKAQSDAQSNTANAQAFIAEEQTKQTQSAATSNITGSYYDLQKTESQQDTIIKVVIVLAIMLVLVTRIKTRK